MTVGGGGGVGGVRGSGSGGCGFGGLGFISGLEINSWIGGLGFISGLEINSWIGGGWENISGWKYYFGGTKLHKCFRTYCVFVFSVPRNSELHFRNLGKWVRGGILFYMGSGWDPPGFPWDRVGGSKIGVFGVPGGFPGGGKKGRKMTIFGVKGFSFDKKATEKYNV